MCAVCLAERTAASVNESREFETKTVMLFFYKCALKIVSEIWSKPKCNIEWGFVLLSHCGSVCMVGIACASW